MTLPADERGPGDEIPLLGIVNTSEEICDMLAVFFQIEGYATVRAFTLQFKRTELDFGAWLAEYRPAVVIWDIAPPYEENWRFFQQIRSAHGGECRFVLTTTNKRVLDQLVGETNTLELVGKPYDLAILLATVQRALMAS